MHQYLDEYEKAPPSREKDAIELFPFTEMSAEEFAARESHKMGCFSFDEYIYENYELNEWIHTLGDILFFPGETKRVRQKYLTAKEIEEIEQQSNNAL